MLAIKCSACKKKLWKYDKIGPGDVLRCHKNRMARVYAFKQVGGMEYGKEEIRYTQRNN